MIKIQIMPEEKFNAQDIPYLEFEMLGISRRDVLDMPKKDLEHLLNGSKTDLKMFAVQQNGQTIRFEGKLSLQRNSDDSLSLVVHPVQKEINNTLGLSEEEISKLKNGDVLSKTIEGERNLLQLDRETNEIINAKTRNIDIPLDISGSERERLFSGKSIEIEIENGEKHKFQLDLLSHNGYRLDHTPDAIRYSGSYFLSTELSRKDIDKYNLDEKNIERLLDGKRTDLLLIDGKAAKLSLQRNSDGSAYMVVHPAQKEINNTFGLSEEEINKLKNGDVLSKTIEGERNLLQLDRGTNEILKKKESLAIPTFIKDIELSTDHKEALRQGSPIVLTNKNGEKVTAKLNLGNAGGMDIKDDRHLLNEISKGGRDAKEILEFNFSKKGYYSKKDMSSFMLRNNLDSKNLSGSARAAFDRRQLELFDFYNPGFCSVLQTDLNRAEFMESLNKGHGIHI